jgi:hypothetical protein
MPKILVLAWADRYSKRPGATVLITDHHNQGLSRRRDFTQVEPARNDQEGGLMLMELAYGTIGRKLRGEHRGHGRHARDERICAVTLARAARRMSTLLVTSAVLLTLIQVAAAQAEPMPIGVPGTWALKLNEEFTGNGVNTALWTPEWPSGAMSEQCTSPSFVSQPGNGYLYLEVRAHESTCSGIKNKDTGGLVESNPDDGKPGHTGFLYSYGYVEWRAWIPGVKPEGLACPTGGCLPDWPALWSLSATSTNEIDTMEGLNTLGEACYHIHPPPGSEGPGGCLSGGYASAWHTFGSEWEPGIVKYFYDGAQVGEVKSGNVNGTPEYLIMTMVPPGVKQPLVVPDEMVVDYVRVWQHPFQPAVSTGTASNVEFRQASFDGSVNPDGGPTEYSYQYGLTNSYGSETSKGNAGTGWGPVSAPLGATGLQPGTTYHFRLVATNPEGTSYGGDETFTTAAPPSLSISNRLQSSMTLTWTASANASTYTIERNGASIGSTSGLTYVDTKLQSTTFYSYEIVANGAGESLGSNVVTRATTPLNTIKADVNGDGKTDLVYIYPGGYIDTFLSKGNGTYTETIEHLAGEFESTKGLWMTGDFNGDGKTDLVYIYPGGYIDTFLSKGNGTYEEKSELIEAGFNSTEGAWEVGDFNGDGKTDLAYILPGGYIDTFLSKGNGTYEEVIEHLEGFNSTGGQWFTGDFNGDGKTDLLYIYPGGYLDTFFSKGNGTYTETIEHLEGFNTTGGQWFTGDFNGDGKTDLLYIYPGGYLDTFFSKGNGTYTETIEHREGFDSSSGQWFTGDFNGDGKTDLAYIYPGGYIDTFLSKGNGTYEEGSELIEAGFNTTSGQWRTGDFNGDGKTDLLYIYPGGYLDTFLSKGSGTYEELIEYLNEFNDTTGLWL